MPGLTIRNLTKRYNDLTVLDRVSLDIAAGEFVALLGPSGSGKTTLLRLLAGFDLPNAGHILIGEHDVSRLPPGERDIGMVFQQYALFPHLTVRRNIEYGLRMRGWARDRRRARTEEILRVVRLDGFADRMPRQLSGGQQQRVAIARALAYSPNFLLMDEPLGALDRALRIEMAEEIRRIHRSLGTTFIYVTHDRDEAMALADRVLVIRHGQVIADGSPQQLYQAPRSAFVGQFFASMNIIDAGVLKQAQNGSIGASAGAVDDLVRHPQDPLYGIPPARLSLTRPGGPYLFFKGEVMDSLFLGDKLQISVACAGLGQPLLVHATPSADTAIGPGATVTVYIERASVVLLENDLR